MGKIVGDTACPVCREKGRDTTGNHLMLYADGGAYCNRCGYFNAKHTEEGDETKVPTVIEKAPDMGLLDRIANLPTRKDYRGIPLWIAELFGVRMECDLSTGDVSKSFYPVKRNGTVTGYKTRGHPKTFLSVGDIKGDKDLFGHGTASKSVVITGGEEDAMAAYYMLTAVNNDKRFEPCVYSLVHGEQAVKDIASNLSFLAGFDKVILCLDNDGKTKEKEMAQLLGERAYVMTFSEKDSNDMLLTNKQQEFISAYFKAKPYAPEGFVTIEDVWEEATSMPVMGREWPWPSLTKLTYGRRNGEGAYFGAGVKVGKSEAVNQFAHHVTQVEGGKIALFKLEETPAMTARKVAGKIKHKQFHIPDGDFTKEELEDGVRSLGDTIVMYDNYGSASWDDLKIAIRHAVLVKGCTDIVIDPLTRLTVGMTASAANEELERVSDEISKMAKDLGFFYLFFCHLKAPPNGSKPHEEGGRVRSNQFTGSRAMMRSCYFMVGIERDKTLEDEVGRNTSSFVLLENRAFGTAGKFNVYYNPDTGDYLEPALMFGK